MTCPCREALRRWLPIIEHALTRGSPVDALRLIEREAREDIAKPCGCEERAERMAEVVEAARISFISGPQQLREALARLDEGEGE